VLAFAEAGVDLAIVEVGLGGRLDATNALHTDVSVITTIGLDHQQILGRTLAEIAGEKAGIVRQGRPVISALQKPPARRVIEERCREFGAPVRFVRPLRHRAAALPDAPAQRQNAAVAVAVAEMLQPFGLSLTPEAIRVGLAQAWLPARQEIVSTDPLLLIDAAHNVDSARALADTLDRLSTSAGSPWLVLGVLRDKDVGAVLRPLLKRAAGVAVATPSSPRALPASELAAACRALSDLPVEEAESVTSALRIGRERAGSGGTVVAGSFVTAAEARVALGLADVLTFEDRARWLERGSPLAD
jgi:dihydrofolate synthase/folylpolyglutamate synthase